MSGPAQDVIPVAVIFAPTACGKTALTERLFCHGSLSVLGAQAEIISADSVAIYKELSVGSAKPGADLRAALPHHLIDILSYTQRFSVAGFVERADAACAQIWGRGNVPVIVGGAGFYIRNFMLGLPSAPESDSAARGAIQARLKEEGAAALHRELRSVDAASAARIHPNDAYRICRALEVWHSAGRALSTFAPPRALRQGYAFCAIILTRRREDLYARICARTERMFRAGLEEEVAGLVRDGATEAAPGMRAIGYREFFLPELRRLPASERTERLKAVIMRDTKKYAKKQITLMRGIPGAVQFHADSADAIAGHIRRWAQAHGIHP